MKKLLLLSALLLPFSANAETFEWQPRYDQSTITFTSTENGNAHETRVGEFEADIQFSANDLENSNVMVNIPVKAFKRDDSEALQTMQEGQFFDAKNYPDITYRADHFEHVKDNEYIAHGYLKIKDIENPLDLPFTLDITDDTADMTSQVTVLRLPYQVGKGSWADTNFIANEVTVDIHLVADRKTP